MYTLEAFKLVTLCRNKTPVIFNFFFFLQHSVMIRNAFLTFLGGDLTKTTKSASFKIGENESESNYFFQKHIEKDSANPMA